jgi:DNA-binding response OmpR family regulator
MRPASGDGEHVVLTVEDNPAEVRLLREAFDAQDRQLTHLVATDSDEAFDVLYSRAETTEEPLPDLVLLDIDLPSRSGIDILTELRDREGFQTLPIIMYSSTNQEETIQTCYREGANAYVVKPTNYDEMVASIDHLLRFWVDTARLTAT